MAEMTIERAVEILNDQQDEFDAKAAEILPCICVPAYKDRSLAQPDCPRCNFGDEVAAALREVAERTQAEGYDKGINAALVMIEAGNESGRMTHSTVEIMIRALKPVPPTTKESK